MHMRVREGEIMIKGLRQCRSIPDLQGKGAFTRRKKLHTQKAPSPTKGAFICKGYLCRGQNLKSRPRPMTLLVRE